MKTVFTTGEAAKICKVSQQTIIRCFDNGQLKGFRVPGSRFRRIPREALYKFMKDNGIPTDALESGKRKVLLVDDDAHSLFAVTSLLERIGVRVVPALGARECFQLLESEPDVDLVMIDVMMPEIDGLEATRQIRTHPGMSDLPIVALTAKALPGDRERCLEAGCSDFAAKPIGPEALIALLQKWTRR